MAMTIGQYAYEVKSSEGSTALEKGPYLNILRKDSGGAWHYSRALWNSSGGAAPDRTRDESAIRETLSAVESTLNARDFAGYAQTFVEGADIVFYPDSRLTGRAAIEADMVKAWKAQPAACRIARRRE